MEIPSHAVVAKTPSINAPTTNTPAMDMFVKGVAEKLEDGGLNVQKVHHDDHEPDTHSEVGALLAEFGSNQTVHDIARDAKAKQHKIENYSQVVYLTRGIYLFSLLVQFIGPLLCRNSVVLNEGG